MIGKGEFGEALRGHHSSDTLASGLVADASLAIGLRSSCDVELVAVTSSRDRHVVDRIAHRSRTSMAGGAAEACHGVAV